MGASPRLIIVAEKELRAPGERTGDGDHLLLTARQQAGASVEEVSEHGERLECGLDCLMIVGACTQPHVLDGGQLVEESAVLGDVCEAAAREAEHPGLRAASRSARRAAQHGQLPLEARNEAGDGQQRRRLADPVRSEQGYDLTGIDIEVESLDDGDSAVADAHVVHLQQRGHWSSSRPR